MISRESTTKKLIFRLNQMYGDSWLGIARQESINEFGVEIKELVTLHYLWLGVPPKIVNTADCTVYYSDNFVKMQWPVSGKEIIERMERDLAKIERHVRVNCEADKKDHSISFYSKYDFLFFVEQFVKFVYEYFTKCISVDLEVLNYIAGKCERVSQGVTYKISELEIQSYNNYLAICEVFCYKKSNIASCLANRICKLIIEYAGPISNFAGIDDRKLSVLNDKGITKKLVFYPGDFGIGDLTLKTDAEEFFNEFEFDLNKFMQFHYYRMAGTNVDKMVDCIVHYNNNFVKMQWPENGKTMIKKVKEDILNIKPQVSINYDIDETNYSITFHSKYDFLFFVKQICKLVCFHFMGKDSLNDGWTQDIIENFKEMEHDALAKIIKLEYEVYNNYLDICYALRKQPTMCFKKSNTAYYLSESTCKLIAEYAGPAPSWKHYIADKSENDKRLVEVVFTPKQRGIVL